MSKPDHVRRGRTPSPERSTTHDASPTCPVCPVQIAPCTQQFGTGRRSVCPVCGGLMWVASARPCERLESGHDLD